MPLHRVRLTSATLAVVAAGMLSLGACSPPDVGPQQTPAGGGANGGQETQAAGGSETVVLVEFAFDPEDLTIPVGTTVVFENQDEARHTATHGEQGQPADDAAFDIDLPAAGDSGEFTFDEAGEFPVTCKVHPDMNMTITVEE